MADKDPAIGSIRPGTEVRAASLETGRALLSVVDSFVESQSQFDRQARVGIARETLEVTREVYLSHVRAQVMDWTATEIAALKRIIASLADKFAVMGFTLPDPVYLVKTSGMEEAFAAYTRSLDTIVLPANMVASLTVGSSYGDPLHPGPSSEYLEKIVNHEFFHLISKNNPALRHRLYGQINYKSTGNEVPLPEVEWVDGRSMPEMKITNPDAPLLDVYIEMEVPVDGGTRKMPLMPVLLAKEVYQGGPFFGVLQWWFMGLATSEAGTWEPAFGADGKPLMFDSAALMDQYYRLVGRNITQEIFHPDEILAQSFVLVSEQPSMALLLAIEKEMATGV